MSAQDGLPSKLMPSVPEPPELLKREPVPVLVPGTPPCASATKTKPDESLEKQLQLDDLDKQVDVAEKEMEFFAAKRDWARAAAAQAELKKIEALKEEMLAKSTMKDEPAAPAECEEEAFAAVDAQEQIIATEVQIHHKFATNNKERSKPKKIAEKKKMEELGAKAEVLDLAQCLSELAARALQDTESQRRQQLRLQTLSV